MVLGNFPEVRGENLHVITISTVLMDVGNLGGGYISALYPVATVLVIGQEFGSTGRLESVVDVIGGPSPISTCTNSLANSAKWEESANNASITPGSLPMQTSWDGGRQIGRVIIRIKYSIAYGDGE